nr:unnamed protein product [Callosobruchus analis]
MSAKRILNSKEVFSDKDLEDIIAASDFSNICASEDNDPDEIDADCDSDDSIADKDYVTDPLDEDSFTVELQSVRIAAPQDEARNGNQILLQRYQKYQN